MGADQIHLGDKADAVFHLAVLFINIRAVQINICVCFFVTDDGIHEGRFACAGAAQQQNQRAVGNIHGNILEQILLFPQMLYSPLPQKNTQPLPGCRRCIHGIADTGNLRRLHAGLPARLEADFRVRLVSFVKSQEKQGDPFSQEPKDQPAPFQIKQKDQAHKNPDSVYVKRDNYSQRDQSLHNKLAVTIKSKGRKADQIIENFQYTAANPLCAHFHRIRESVIPQSRHPCHPSLFPMHFFRQFPQSQRHQKPSKNQPAKNVCHNVYVLCFFSQTRTESVLTGYALTRV